MVGISLVTIRSQGNKVLGEAAIPGWTGSHGRTTRSISSAGSTICMIGSTGERIGRSRSGGSIYRSRDGRQRPLAIAALEDKIVQRATRRAERDLRGRLSRVLVRVIRVGLKLEGRHRDLALFNLPIEGSFEDATSSNSAPKMCS
jgi:hypothetical protein